MSIILQSSSELTLCWTGELFNLHVYSLFDTSTRVVISGRDIPFHFFRKPAHLEHIRKSQTQPSHIQIDVRDPEEAVHAVVHYTVVQIYVLKVRTEWKLSRSYYILNDERCVFSASRCAKSRFAYFIK